VVMKTKPIPMSRGRISAATKVVMKALSVAERLLHAEYELIVLARKPAEEVGRDDARSFSGCSTSGTRVCGAMPIRTAW